MAHTLAVESQLIGQDLYQLLKMIDPARWRNDLEASTREELHALRSRLTCLLEGTEVSSNDASVSALRDLLHEIGVLLERKLPAPNLPGERLRGAWEDFRLEALPTYERLAANLHLFDIHLPSLRPTNYARNVYHACSGLGVILLVELILDVSLLIPVAGFFTICAWSMEISRRIVPGINRFLLWWFKPFAHPHEAWRVNSATWFTSAMFLLALLQDTAVITAAISVLALADPCAAIVGRRFGRHPLVHGRTLEGTLAFIVVGTLAALLSLLVFHPDLPGGIWLALTAATAGSIGELFSRRIDDNLAIPISAAMGMMGMMAILGL